MDVVEPYKVGTFEIGGTPTVSLVLRDQMIGTLTMPVVAGDRPSGDSGARLPPINTYRDR